MMVPTASGALFLVAMLMLPARALGEGAHSKVRYMFPACLRGLYMFGVYAKSVPTTAPPSLIV